jgi:hypothetical protein
VPIAGGSGLQAEGTQCDCGRSCGGDRAARLDTHGRFLDLLLPDGSNDHQSGTVRRHEGTATNILVM